MNIQMKMKRKRNMNLVIKNGFGPHMYQNSYDFVVPHVQVWGWSRADQVWLMVGLEVVEADGWG